MKKYFRVGNLDSADGARFFVNTYDNNGRLVDGNIALDTWDGATLITEQEYNSLNNYTLIDDFYFNETGKALYEEKLARQEEEMREIAQAQEQALQVRVDLAVKIIEKFLEQNLFTKEDLPMILSFFRVPPEVITPAMERINAA